MSSVTVDGLVEAENSDRQNKASSYVGHFPPQSGTSNSSSGP